MQPTPRLCLNQAARQSAHGHPKFKLALRLSPPAAGVKRVVYGTDESTAMIYWAPLLHFYQPPTQLHWVLRKVYRESYRPLVDLFRSLPHAEVTVNINAVLTEMLYEHGMSDVIDGLRDLAEQGRLDFTGSAKYHAILPLLSPDDMLRQIVHNHQTNRRFFGDAYSPSGFFPPEMCYGRNIVKPVLETGHRWIILSGIACPGGWPTTTIHQVSGDSQRLAVFFRDDVLSNRISFRQVDARGFIEQLRQSCRKDTDTYVVTAMDAETFGHHIQHWEQLFLSEVYRTLAPQADPGAAVQVDPWAEPGPQRASRKPGPAEAAVVQDHGALLRTVEAPETGIKVVTLTNLLKLVPTGGPIEPKASSWSTSADDLAAGNPYPLWKSRDNELHQLLWKHLRLAVDMTHKALDVANTDAARGYADIARALLDQALHSDQFWWASRRPWWDVNLVERGLTEQRHVVLNAYKAIRTSDIPEDVKAQQYYHVLASRDLSNKIADILLAS